MKTVCAKEYVDALNATVTEMKEKYIFRFETFTPAQMTTSKKACITVHSPVPQGYERMAATSYCSGIPVTFWPILSDDGQKTQEELNLWLQDANFYDANTIIPYIVNIGLFTIFVKKE